MSFGMWFYFNQKQQTRVRLGLDQRSAVVAKIKQHGVSGLRFQQLVDELQEPPEVAKDTAEELYSRLCQKVVADAVITESERKQLEQMRKALSLNREDASEIETGAKEQKYRSAALEALEDGIITENKEIELESLRKQLSVPLDRYPEIIGNAASGGLTKLFRQITANDKPSPSDLDQLRRFRSAWGFRRDEANEILNVEVLKLYRRWYTDIAKTES